MGMEKGKGFASIAIWDEFEDERERELEDIWEGRRWVADCKPRLPVPVTIGFQPCLYSLKGGN